MRGQCNLEPLSVFCVTNYLSSMVHGGELALLLGVQRQLDCGQIVCVVDQFRTATVCLKLTKPTEADKMLRPEELSKSEAGLRVSFASSGTNNN